MSSRIGEVEGRAVVALHSAKEMKGMEREMGYETKSAKSE